MTDLDFKWPNFFVVGAARCGTTSIYEYLKKHPQIFMPKLKEPDFFAESLRPVPRSEARKHCPSDLRRYRSLYEGAGKHDAIGDVSPSYLWDEDAPRKIRAACPNARIIIMLRDPVERAYSHYLLKVQEGMERRPFLTALQEDYSSSHKGWWASQLYVELGLYCDQVSRYLETFSNEQVAIFLFEDLKRNAEELLTRIARHIGVDPNLVEKPALEMVYNGYKMPRSRVLHKAAKGLDPRLKEILFPPFLRSRLYRSNLLYNFKKPPLDDESRRFLQEIYKPEISKLENLLGRKIPQLRKSWL